MCIVTPQLVLSLDEYVLLSRAYVHMLLSWRDSGIFPASELRLSQSGGGDVRMKRHARMDAIRLLLHHTWAKDSKKASDE